MNNGYKTFSSEQNEEALRGANNRIGRAQQSVGVSAHQYKTRLFQKEKYIDSYPSNNARPNWRWSNGALKMWQRRETGGTGDVQLVGVPRSESELGDDKYASVYIAPHSSLVIK